MIELYTWGTPNGRKISIMLEEIGMPYNVHPVNLRTNEQKTPEFLAINPNGRIPAIIDTEGPGGRPLTIFESGAILIYLAEKSGQVLPREPVRRMEAIQWLMFQMAGVGPMFGQLGWFRRNAPDNHQGITRYTDESLRLARVLDQRLGEAEYLAGAYSIADIAARAQSAGCLAKARRASRIARHFPCSSRAILAARRGRPPSIKLLVNHDCRGLFAEFNA
jgi:GST-like protein